jgi:hypothetical protein
MHHETPIRRSLFRCSHPRDGGNSNRYTLRIEFPVSYRKRGAASPFNQCAKGRCLASRDAVPGTGSITELRSSSLQPQHSLIQKINRKPELVETLVSQTKQRAVLQINRKLSSTPAAPLNGPSSHSTRSISALPAGKQFLIETLLRIERWPNSAKTKEKTFSNRNKQHVLPLQCFSTSHIMNSFRQGTAFYPERSRRATVPTWRTNSGVSTPEGRGPVDERTYETRSSYSLVLLAMTLAHRRRTSFVEGCSRITSHQSRITPFLTHNQRRREINEL